MEEKRGIPRLSVGAREAAKALGISERTLWALTKEGGIPSFRIGRRVLYGIADLEAWVEQQKGPRVEPR